MAKRLDQLFLNFNRYKAFLGLFVPFSPKLPQKSEDPRKLVFKVSLT